MFQCLRVQQLDAKAMGGSKLSSVADQEVRENVFSFGKNNSIATIFWVNCEEIAWGSLIQLQGWKGVI